MLPRWLFSRRAHRAPPIRRHHPPFARSQDDSMTHTRVAALHEETKPTNERTGQPLRNGRGGPAHISRTGRQPQRLCSRHSFSSAPESLSFLSFRRSRCLVGATCSARHERRGVRPICSARRPRLCVAVPSLLLLLLSSSSFLSVPFLSFPFLSFPFLSFPLGPLWAWPGGFALLCSALRALLCCLQARRGRRVTPARAREIQAWQ
jgi:hypothetical protein